MIVLYYKKNTLNYKTLDRNYKLGKDESVFFAHGNLSTEL